MAGQFARSKWQKVIVESYLAFQHTSELLSDSSAIHTYAANVEGLAVEDGDEEEIVAIARQIKPTLAHGRAIYFRQMLVYFQTIVEVMLEEFLVSVFEQHPERMHDYLVGGPQKTKGFVNLKQIVDAETRERLISNLASEAARELVGGRFETALSSVQKVALLKFDEQLVKDLIALAKERNRIVHENPDLTVTREQVFECLDVVIGLSAALRPSASASQ